MPCFCSVYVKMRVSRAAVPKGMIPLRMRGESVCAFIHLFVSPSIQVRIWVLRVKRGQRTELEVGGGWGEEGYVAVCTDIKFPHCALQDILLWGRRPKSSSISLLTNGIPLSV